MHPNAPVFKSETLIYAVSMAVEIELKAHVTNWDALKRLLSEKAEYLWAFEKTDTYWFPEKNSFPWFPPSGLRLRREKRCSKKGTETSLCLVTYKNKEVKDGIEVNDEREFEVSAPKRQSAVVFEEFLKKIGLIPGSSKKKRGWAFSREGINAELVEVEGLGWFVELEIIDPIHADSDMEAAFTEGKKRLLEFLDFLGIEREAIESRFYTEMLKE